MNKEHGEEVDLLIECYSPVLRKRSVITVKAIPVESLFVYSIDDLYYIANRDGQTILHHIKDKKQALEIAIELDPIIDWNMDGREMERVYGKEPPQAMIDLGKKYGFLVEYVPEERRGTPIKQSFGHEL